MSYLLALHQLAVARGDGLHPALLDLMQHRACRIEADPQVVDIAAVRDNGFQQAGPCPGGRAPHFLPGNVIPFAPRTEPAARPAAVMHSRKA